MKIGVMLRHLDQPGGIGVYTSRLLNTLFQIDQKNEYWAIYSQPNHLGRFADFPIVKETVVPAPNKLWWDQVSVPHFAQKNGLDLIFNPKLSVPLLTRCKTVNVMHGAEQFAVPKAFKWHDRIYFKVANPFYCRKATAIISPTHQCAQDISKYMGADLKRTHVINHAYNDNCKLLMKDQVLAVKRKHKLPDHFILFVGGLSPLKNFGNLLKAYKLIGNSFPHKLVCVGFRRWKYSKDIEMIRKLDIKDKVLFTGFVPDEDIPAFYNLADLFVFPSLYEGFGMPVLEAMACGCPVITTETGCSPEVAGGAAVLTNPYDVRQIAESIKKVLGENSFRKELIQKGLTRAGQFSWNNCARETLALFDSLNNHEHIK